jgi:hypothetical protein
VVFTVHLTNGRVDDTRALLIFPDQRVCKECYLANVENSVVKVLEEEANRIGLTIQRQPSLSEKSK